MKRNITLAGVAAAGALLFTQPASPASVAGVNIAMTNVAVNGCGSIEVTSTSIARQDFVGASHSPCRSTE